MDPEIPTQGVDLQALGGFDEVDGPVHLVEQGQHIARITRVALGHPMRKDKAGSGLGEQTDFAPELGWTMAFAFDYRGNGGVIRMDDFALTERFALGQALRLFGDLPMRVARGLQVA